VNTVLFTALAMLAFAANSLLCRLALGAGTIDAAGFTGIRVASGALLLGLIVIPRWRHGGVPRVDWRAVAMLFAYMILFSFAYLSLGAGTGALILFGAVQLTMFGFALRTGEAFARLSWAGLALAVGGLVYLVSPGVTAPNPVGASLMGLAGVAWGSYSLLGRRTADPMQVTALNFICALPLAGVTVLLSLHGLHVTPQGAVLAAASGAVASGLGYFLWYAALRGLAATQAATVQLCVPVIAAFGGVLLLGETVSLRLILASIATLGGIALVLSQKHTGRARSHRQ
jgi:drug/metabolite transporter (DMT)-like permease